MEMHERARRLIDAARIEGISPDERDWLDAHLEQCLECSAHSESTERALHSLRGIPMQIDPAVVNATRLKVQHRAAELREQRERARTLWIACGLSWAWGVISAPLLWRASEWIGQSLHVADLVWQAGFLLMWFLPGSIAAAFLAWRHTQQAQRH